jgi:sugar phosphate isomerase/epimerase
LRIKSKEFKVPETPSRRAVLVSAASAGAALLAHAAPAPPDQHTTRPKLKVAIFSKHLQFVQGEDLAQAAASLGFDAVDITVRKGGHVDPVRVRQDLPPLVAILRRHALDVPMITTDIVDADTPHAEDVLATMADLGIHRYRWGGLTYAPGQPYPAQLDRMKPRIARLAALNSRYRACAMYHTHSGRNLVGASIWDLYILLKDYDPAAVAVNFDIGHAVIEGGLGGWINSFRITGPRLRGIAVKDFVWAQEPGHNWNPQWVPLGQGMVPFAEFFAMVAAANFDGPVQVHFEYPLSEQPEEVYPAMKRDLAQLRRYLAQAKL